jgi:plasmid segregation protein ParM
MPPDRGSSRRVTRAGTLRKLAPRHASYIFGDSMEILGLDIGYSNLKLACGTASERPHPTLTVLPAGAAPANRLSEPISQSGPPLRVRVDEEEFVVGVPQSQLQDWNRVLHKDYPTTPSYRALFHAALVMTRQRVIDLVVTGLPVSQYQDKTKRIALIKQLEGKHRVTQDDAWVEVKKAVVVPQPFGGFMDVSARGYGGSIDMLTQSRVLVVDPGFFSLDWMLVVEGELRLLSSGTSQQAGSVILEEADKRIANTFGAGLGRERLEDAIRTGKNKVVLYGEWVELHDYLQSAIAARAPVAMAALQESLRNDSIQDIDILILVGGGALFFKEAACRLFPRSRLIMATDPWMANARGFFYQGIATIE